MLAMLGSIASQGGIMLPETILYMKFENNLIDEVTGINAQLTQSGGLLEYGVGAFGTTGIKSKISTDGNYVQVLKNFRSVDYFDYYSTNWTMQFWVRFDSVPYASSLRIFLNGFGYGFEIAPSSTQPLNIHTGYDYKFSTKKPNSGEYTFIRIIKNGAYVEMYMNGVFCVRATADASVTRNITGIYFYMIASGGTGHYTYVDDFVMLKGLVLSGLEVPTSQYF